MAIEKDIYSDLPIPPGEYFAEVLKEKGISQAEIARRMGRPAQAINEIIRGQKAITSETALQLERSLGVPAHIWIGLEVRYRLIKARQLEMRQLRKDLPLLTQIPYQNLARMGFVKKTRNKLDQIRELHRFFGVSALSNIADVKAYVPAFRLARRRNASPYALVAWLKCAEILAQETQAKSFNKESLHSSIPKIRELTLEPPDVFKSKLEKMLSDCGVAVVFMPHLPKTYAHAAAFWLAEEKAVIVISIRGSWADIFWFSLFHELAHILLQKKHQTFIDDGEVSPEMQGQEEEANSLAKDQLIHPDDYQRFISLSSLTANSIREFANQVGIAPGIVVGRLQHDGHLRQDSRLNMLRERFKWKLND